MSLNATATPFPIQIIPRELPWYIYAIAVAVIVVMGLVMTAFFYYKPPRLTMRITKNPDGTFRLAYLWAWHVMGASQSELHEASDSLIKRIGEIVEKTEWKTQK